MVLTDEQLRTEISKLIDAGDQAALEKFLVEHFTELPQEVQGKVLLAFTEEALEREAANDAMRRIQDQGFEAMDKIMELKRSLEHDAE